MATRNFAKNLKLQNPDHQHQFNGTEIVFENRLSKEQFKGTVESHRDNDTLYVRVPILRDSVQRVKIKDILCITKLSDSLNTKASQEFQSKEFLFLPDGSSFKKLKDDATRSRKQTGERSNEALERLSKERFNTSYKKLVELSKKSSPFMKDGIVYFPFSLLSDADDLPWPTTYYAVLIGDSLVIDGVKMLQGVCSFNKGHSLQFGDFECIDVRSSSNVNQSAAKGWRVHPSFKQELEDDFYNFSINISFNGELLEADITMSEADGSYEEVMDVAWTGFDYFYAYDELINNKEMVLGKAAKEVAIALSMTPDSSIALFYAYSHHFMVVVNGDGAAHFEIAADRERLPVAPLGAELAEEERALSRFPSTIDELSFIMAEFTAKRFLAEK